MSDESFQRRDFFISYNSADKVHAEAINSALRDAGYTTHFAGTDCAVGTNLVAWIEGAIIYSKQVLAICSHEYFGDDAPYSAMERDSVIWGDPVSSERRLVPVLLPGFNHTELTPTMSFRRCIDLETVSPWESARKVMIELGLYHKPLYARMDQFVPDEYILEEIVRRVGDLPTSQSIKILQLVKSISKELGDD